MTPDDIRRYAAIAVPRYTSYPTAPHFHAGIDHTSYRTWLGELPPQSEISLYVHVPFCDTLCWFCGCHTKITRQYAPVSSYLDALIAEAHAIGSHLPDDARVSHIHWGGGSPTILRPVDIQRLASEIERTFPSVARPEFAIEVDPRGLTPGQVDALAASGLTRVSIGVQDFDETVQKAINRLQSFEETRAAVDMFRAAGVTSINIDAIYGLPGQHEPQLRQTLARIIELAPERISLFGYAHVPWLKRHQAMIREADLPEAVERHSHAELAANLFEEAGYARIGLDHFARPSDSMAIAHQQRTLGRNFQGYTVDTSTALIGLGASAIGRLPQGYVQNATPIAEYMRQALSGGLATVRGYALTAEDKVRARLIERLMCDFCFTSDDLGEVEPELASALRACASDIVTGDHDNFVEPRMDGFALTARGKPFVRLIAARFDAHLAAGRGRHSAAV